MLVKSGLDLSNIKIVVDKHLVDLHNEVHGISISHPEDIAKKEIDIIYVCSRQFYSEISKELKALNNQITCKSLFE